MPPCNMTGWYFVLLINNSFLNTFSFSNTGNNYDTHNVVTSLQTISLQNSSWSLYVSG